MAVVEPEQTVNALTDKLNQVNDEQKDLELNESKSPMDLFTDAKKCIENEDYNNAVEFLANALEIINSSENEINGEDIKFAEYYFEYGKALLNLIQQKSNFIALGGDNANVDYDNYDDYEEENDEVDEENADVNNPVNNNDDNTNDEEKKENMLESVNDSTLNHQNENENETNEAVNNNDVKNNEKEELDEEDAENAENSNGVQNDAENQEMTNSEMLNEDRAIAWENLEIARIMVEKYLSNNDVKKNEEEIEKYTLLLIDIITYLGQHLLEDDKFNESIEEFNKALEIITDLKTDQIKMNDNKNDEIETKHNRLISSIYFWLYLATNFNECYKDAMKHCENAIKSLNDRIFFLLNKKLNLDINGVQKNELLNYATKYLEENEDETKQSIKNELKELVELMGDLVLKLEDCHEIIENQKNIKNNMNDNNNNNNNNNNNDLESNPLKAMIANLVSKFGISAEQLQSLDDEPQKNNDKNNENKNNLNAVTTIGFGNHNNQNKDDENDDVFELGTFGSSKNKNNNNNKVNKSRKRTLNETDIEPNLPAAKKVKLNSGEESRVSKEEKKSE